jgi:hypothetical protein
VAIDRIDVAAYSKRPLVVETCFSTLFRSLISERLVTIEQNTVGDKLLPPSILLGLRSLDIGEILIFENLTEIPLRLRPLQHPLEFA